MTDDTTEANEEMKKLSKKYPSMIFFCAPRDMSIENFLMGVGKWEQ